MENVEHRNDRMIGTVLRAVIDKQFRTSLVRDPRATLLETDVVLPPDISVRVVVPSEHELVLVVPPLLPQDFELTEDALAAAQGGFTPTVLIGFGVVGLFTAGGLVHHHATR